METIDDLIGRWDMIEKDPSFTPFAFYNKTGDAIEAFSSNEPRVVERINTLLSVYVAEADRNKVVGIVIKNISKHFGKDPLTFFVKTGRAKIAVLVRGTQLDQAHSYTRREAATENSILVEQAVEKLGEIEVDLPELQTSDS